MHPNKRSPTEKKAVTGDDITFDLKPYICTYKDGRVERFVHSPFVPASDIGAASAVATKDVTIDGGGGVSARLFLPSGRVPRLPLVVYFHGGFFCMESAFCQTYHRYAASLALRAGALVVSVEYRLAPEHPVPAAYDDAWDALRWTASLSDPWLVEYAELGRTFVAGDSAGANIAYNVTVRAGRRREDGISIEGLVLLHPFFWGAERLPYEEAWVHGMSMYPPCRVDTLWPFVTAGKVAAGNDDPRINPTGDDIASLTCRRALVAIAMKDTLRDRGRSLANRMRGGGSNVTVTLVETEGEDHSFHIYKPRRATSEKLMASVVQFIHQSSTSRL